MPLCIIEKKKTLNVGRKGVEGHNLDWVALLTIDSPYETLHITKEITCVSANAQTDTAYYQIFVTGFKGEEFVIFNHHCFPNKCR